MRDPSLKRVLVIGSGPIIIGQAAEFDYAGTQAIRALKEEGVEVILVNSNPATIMTDRDMADRVYLEPLLPDVVGRILEKEQPDGLLPTLGGQVGLNLAAALAREGYLDRLGIRMLGTPVSAIEQAEDRDAFRSLMLSLGEPIPASRIIKDVPSGLAFAQELGFPLIVRPAYTLGGTGGGFAHSLDEFKEILSQGLAVSPVHEVLVERSIFGWKEVEYEVMRDRAGNAITVCNMENFDAVGVHTGDSIVVAPSLTLSDHEYQMLRSASLRIVEALGVIGGCNVQLGLHPETGEYRVIEVNPRVSRSSALASKATGYPIARMAAKLALGLTLDELQNPITRKTTACFEPALDYVVVKVPRWPFDKFVTADRKLGTQMKATGEVMALDRTFQGALQKAVRALDMKLDCLELPGAGQMPQEQLEVHLENPDDQRLFYIAEAFRRGMTRSRVEELTSIAPYFLSEIANLVEKERTLPPFAEVDRETLTQLKRSGFSDRRLGVLWGRPEEDVELLRRRLDVRRSYKMVDTCAGEFAAETPYFYSCFGAADEALPQDGKKVLVIGSGPIRIGQGIEFDCSTVHALRALREHGIRAVMVNCNPETVSTDFTESDRLYFEPLTVEDVTAIAEKEEVMGIIVQLGGQTAINVARALHERGFALLGTPLEGIECAEDRGQFDQLLERLGIERPKGVLARTMEGAEDAAAHLGYPVLVRPSFVLGGRAMEIIESDDELRQYAAWALGEAEGKDLLIDKYHAGKEYEVDALSDGAEVLVAGIMEHIERAGVHSGDSMAAYPTFSLSAEMRDAIMDASTRIALGLGVRGLINIQFVVSGGRLLVIEANPRASRTVPFLEKVAGLPISHVATGLMLGQSLKDLGYRSGLWAEPDHFGVKVPVFSWAKLRRVDAFLGPEMKSTGEVLGIDPSFDAALLKALQASGTVLQGGRPILLTVADRDKEELLPLARALGATGFPLVATEGTAYVLRSHGVAVDTVRKIGERSPDILDEIRSGRIALVINTMTRGREPRRHGFRIRRTAVEHGVPCITSLDTAKAVLRALQSQVEPALMALQEYTPPVREESAP